MFNRKKNLGNSQAVSAYEMGALSDQVNGPHSHEGSPDQHARVTKLEEVGKNVAMSDGLMAQAGVIRPRQAQLAEDYRDMPRGFVPSSIHVSQEAKDRSQQIGSTDPTSPAVDIQHRLSA